MATRWIKGDRSRRHSVALLSQKRPVPEELNQSARESGGEIHVANVSDPFLQRAAWLRKQALENADYVLLHIDMDDVIAPTAFGCAGGPPVLFVNHAAHVFWTGASIVDLVVNSRGSALEIEWTVRHRGIPRCGTVPIPLLEPSPEDGRNATAKKAHAKEALGVPKDSVLVLTSGEGYKYSPIGGLDFITTCEEILRACPSICMVAIGPAEDDRWKEARERSNGRLKSVGRQPRDQVKVYLQAADVYAEGFPFGSTTALLEAGLQGIPAVLAPVQCPPPYGTDGVAVDEVLERAKSLEEYRTKIVQLAVDPDLRARVGGALSTAVMNHHTGDGWRRHLESAIRQLPTEHAIYPPEDPAKTPENIHRYWEEFAGTAFPWVKSLSERAVSYAFASGLRPLPPDSRNKNGGGQRNEVRARILAAFGDQYQWIGELALARRFYSCSLEYDPGKAKVLAKKALLAFGRTGALLRKGVRSLRK
jgi:hypothetical protein